MVYEIILSLVCIVYIFKIQIKFVRVKISAAITGFQAPNKLSGLNNT